MPPADVTLESLTRIIESLQETIRRDGRTVGANETRTRNTLIDPILSALGWADPSVVTQEYLVRYGPREFDYGVADYALHPPGDRANPVAFLEAKRMAENLTDDYREQVLRYALDKGGTLRQFGLTNGDRWELYELYDGEPLPILRFSIRKDAAANCAALLLSHFPMLSRPSVERSLGSVEVLPIVSRNAGVISRTPEINITSPRLLNEQVDKLKALTWLAVSLVVFGIFGWAYGVLTAEPIDGFFELAGLFGIGIALILASLLVRRLNPSIVPVFFNVLRLRWMFLPIAGNRQKTLIWVVLATVCGIGAGGVGGYFIGLQTGQAIVNALETLGQIVVALIVIIFIIGLLLGSGKRRGRWKPRSSYRKRRW